MTQLVGQSCVHCSARLSNELDAGFCPTCGLPSHNACRRPAAAGPDLCPACGAGFGAASRRARAAELAETARAATPRPLDLVGAAREARRLYKLLRLAVPGVLIVFVGVAMFAAPSLRDDPSRVSIGDVVRGAAVGLAGVAIVLLGWWQYRDARRAGKRKAEPGAAPDTAM